MKTTSRHGSLPTGGKLLLALLAASAVQSPGLHAQTLADSLTNLGSYLFVFTDGSVDANWQGASKGFVGNVAVNGITASERTSGNVPYAGKIYTNDSSLGAWQNIVNNNPGQASGFTGQTTRLSDLSNDLDNSFSKINALAATSMVSNATSLNGLNTQNGLGQVTVIDISGGFQVSSQIHITGDANDVFIFRWDDDLNSSNGYNGTVKFQSGGAIVPEGGLGAKNFINVAGEIASSGGGNNPNPPFPQGPRLGTSTGPLIDGGSDFNGGGFFTGSWLTTGNPDDDFKQGSLSNAIFVGGWYTSATQFSMTSGTSGVHYDSPTVTLLPEPGSLCLGALSVGMMCFSRRRKS